MDSAIRVILSTVMRAAVYKGMRGQSGVIVFILAAVAFVAMTVLL